jgi:hypothetical protein
MTGLLRSRSGLHGPLLHQRDLLQRQFHAEVAAGDHDPVEGLDDRLEVLDRLRLLQLGDDGDGDVLLPHDVAHQLDVGRRAHERQRDEVHRQVQGEAEVLLVLVRHRRAR